MLLHDPQRRGEEVKLLTQSIQQVSLVRKVQTRLSSRREHHKRRWPHACLRQVLNFETRHPTPRRRRRGPATRLRNSLFKEIGESRSRNSAIASFIGFQNERQNLLNALSGQRRNCDHRRPIQKLHLVAQISLKLRGG